MKKTIINEISKYFSLETLQQIQVLINRNLHVESGLLSLDDSVCIGMCTRCKTCIKMEGNENSNKFCSSLRLNLINQLKTSKKLVYTTCPLSGLTMMFLPLVVDKEIKAAFVLSQFYRPNYEMSLSDSLLKDHNYTRELVVKNLEGITFFNEHKFNNLIEIVTLISEGLTEIINKNLTITNQNLRIEELYNHLAVSGDIIQRLSENTGYCYYISDLKTGQILSYNYQFEREFQAIPNLDKKKCFELFGFSEYCQNCPKFHGDAMANKKTSFEFDVYSSPIKKWYRCSSGTFKSYKNEELLLTILKDITAEKEIAIKFEELAYYDSHLEIPNLLKLNVDIKNMFYFESYIMVIDLSGIKKNNILYGREATNLFLHAFVDWVKNTGRHQLYRLGGSKFAILLSNISNESVTEYANEVYERFNRSWDISKDGITYTMYVDVRIALFPKTVLTADDDIKTIADTVLQYFDSEEGLIIYDDKTDTSFKRFLKLENIIKNSILNDMEGFEVVYQPVIRTSNEYWAGLEALCRFETKEGMKISPLEFIPIVEQLGLIDKLGEWVLETAISDIKTFGLEQVEGFVLNVNMSPLQVNNPYLVSMLDNLIASYNYPKKALCLEITESAELVFTDQIKANLQKIKDSGTRLALDDFGIGYSTLLHLKNLPVRMIKTDRSFLDNLENDTYLQEIIKVIVQLAHAASKVVTVEGVERAAQANILKAIGVDFFQGFYYSKPLSKNDIKLNLSKCISKKDYQNGK